MRGGGLLFACLLFASACDRAPTGLADGQRQVDGVPASESRIDDALATELRERIERIDEEMPGNFGVHVRDLRTGLRIEHESERTWYLASVIKVPVAMAVLEQVQLGSLSLDQTLELQRSDFVDGAGDLIWQEPGGQYRLEELIRRSVRESDSTATDMLIRLIGENSLNRRIRTWVGRSFEPITTILQVRYDAYGELHPGVAELSNMDLVRLRNADAGAARLEALRQVLDVDASELAYDSIDEAFERYYERGPNSAILVGVGDLLEQLYQGERLDHVHTELLLEHMRAIDTGTRRIQAGLNSGVRFAQKTGTQLARACNVGIIETGSEAGTEVGQGDNDRDVETERGDDDSGNSMRRGGIVIAACAERFETIEQAEQAFQALGRAIQSTLLDDSASAP